MGDHAKTVPWYYRSLAWLALASGANTVYIIMGERVPWQLKAAAGLATALPIALALLAIPKPVLAKMSQKPCLTPNWITLWGFLSFLAGILAFHYGLILLTVILSGSIGGVLDVMDGKMEVARREAGLYRSPHEIRRGKWLDPLSDKLKYLPMIAVFAYASIIPIHVAAAIILFDIGGTLIRNPVNIGARMYWMAKRQRTGWRKRYLRWTGIRLVRKSKASGFGKAKATFQSLGLLTCLPRFLGWTTDSYSLIVPSVIYWLALVFGIASVISRLRVHPTFDRLVDRIGDYKSLFKHQDFDFGRL